MKVPEPDIVTDMKNECRRSIAVPHRGHLVFACPLSAVMTELELIQRENHLQISSSQAEMERSKEAPGPRRQPPPPPPPPHPPPLQTRTHIYAPLSLVHRFTVGVKLNYTILWKNTADSSRRVLITCIWSCHLTGPESSNGVCLWVTLIQIAFLLSFRPDPSPLHRDGSCRTPWTLWVRPPTTPRQFYSTSHPLYQADHTLGSHHAFISSWVPSNILWPLLFQRWFCGFLWPGAGGRGLPEGSAPGGSSLLRGSGGGTADCTAPCPVPALHPQPRPCKLCPPVIQTVCTQVWERSAFISI